MTPRQKIELKLIEFRKRMNQINLLEGAEYSDEIKTEEKQLQADLLECEVRMKSAILAEDPTPPAADPQLVTLENRASLGNIFDSVINKRATDGAEAELQTELRIKNNYLPLCLLPPRRER